jgi:asparagine synthase (glutamine-hydrolysing)
VFSGYRRYARLARASSRPKLPAPLARTVGRLSPSSSWLASRIGTAAALRDPSPTRGYENMAGLLTTYQLRRLLKGERPAALRAALEDTFRHFGPTGPQAADVQLYLTDDLLVKMDRATMAYGLEARAPLLRPSLVEWGLSLSPSQRGAAGAKRLPRSLLGRVLPGDLARRPKQGFSVPLSDWLRGPLRQSLVDAVDDSYLVGQGYVDRAFLAELVARLDSRRPGAAPVLWAMICFERWREHWKAD